MKNLQIPSDASRLPVTLPALAEKKRLGEPIVMVTAYDYPSARAAEAAGVDLVLVGDSGAMTVLGYDSTVPVTLDELLVLAAAVRRGLSTPFLVGDLPFGSYEVSDEQAVADRTCASSRRPAATPSSSRAAAPSRSPAPGRSRSAGIPVMGHVGLTPQTSTALGGYKAQGRSAEGAMKSRSEALALQEAGCFSIVFEAIPSALSADDHAAHASPGDRDRRRPGDRRPGAGVPRPARHPRGPRRALRQALRRPPGGDGRRRRRLRRRRALARATPRPSTATRSTTAELEAFRESFAR